MMIVWWIGVAVPRITLRTHAIAALAVCFAVELSQLFHTPMLDAIRRTVPGHLLIGSGYDPRDFVAYAAGVFAAALLVGFQCMFRITRQIFARIRFGRSNVPVE